MTFGTLYYHPDYARSNWLVALGDYLGLTIEGKVAADSTEFPESFPLKRTPAFISSDGFKLTESLAIAFYIVNSSSKPEIAGKTVQEQANNWRWYSYLTSDMVNHVGSIYFAKTEEEKASAVETMNKNLEYIDNRLSDSKFLVGDTILVCDIFARSYFRMLQHFKVDFSNYKNIENYVSVVAKHPIFSETKHE